MQHHLFNSSASRMQQQQQQASTWGIWSPMHDSSSASAQGSRLVGSASSTSATPEENSVWGLGSAATVRRPRTLLSPDAPTFDYTGSLFDAGPASSAHHLSDAMDGLSLFQSAQPSMRRASAVQQLHQQHPQPIGAGKPGSSMGVKLQFQQQQQQQLFLQQQLQQLQQQQQQHGRQAKPGIGHEIDRWIASVTCSAPISGPGLSPQGPNHIVLDKGTLLNFLSKLKMNHQKKREMKIELCVFCRQNQEPFHVYTSHRLTDIEGNVTCPVLFQYVCPICHATGSRAHTIKYCPLGNGQQQQQQQSQPLSGEACLRTPRNSVGNRRG